MKPLKLIALGALLGVVLVAVAAEPQVVKQVKSGELQLTCLFEDGERVVDPAMVVGLTDRGWEFENGYASQCRGE